MNELEKKLSSVCDSLALAQKEFEQGAECCAQAIHVMHERIERIENWMQKNVFRVNETE